MELRNTEINDFHAIMSWIKDEYECRNWAGNKVRFPLNINDLLNDISYSNNNSYCLVNENSILAFGQLFPKEDGLIHMARIIVAPLYRGFGYGKILCNNLLQITEQSGYRKVSLYAFRSNSVSIALYKKLGFNKVVEESSGDRCYMVKT
jgi:ribosomal protein S18 acetylase RimI-like enzyme